MDDELVADPGRHRRRVAFDHQVEVERPATEEEVADGSADQVHPGLVAERPQQRAARWKRGDPLEHLGWRGDVHRQIFSFSLTVTRRG